MKLIVGLGNPGERYAATRHNVGFHWLCRLAGELRIPFKSEAKFHGLCANIMQGDEPLWLLKPETYMNASGMAVAALSRFYKISPDQVLIVHDELDLPPGTAKLKLGGGAGGHNGLKDIISRLATKDFWRLRIGIGHPGNKNEVADYVLHPPRKEEALLIDDAIQRSLVIWPLIASGDYSAAMHKLHTKQKET
ncbi:MULTISPECIES: aminoacyl-tRNA hydrolase [unclassified Nitrosomonas]|jgi:PTH1 family peptidyl-tRNA hydrolase|uniref:aminoacyl-tRNA hydrolase n=1 Tax=unclassified Nitrosomonas TaxID=2609265 RepID=UPI0008803F19|nr:MULTISPECIES: aminoacyl-tRNA hydrolase [unclassified Nitrosomonas]SDH19233.1 peptidyl-tRNA hydrolase, PTH1 family [Nitrosomonas sp. Nm132]SDY04276.1 peptidyl-tRNA hydrolase, PTH1 family [Nitrosomonas sp. Nm58]